MLPGAGLPPGPLVPDLHPALGRFHRAEPALLIDPVGVPGDEEPLIHVPQLFMFKYGAHHETAGASAPVPLIHAYVQDVGEPSPVRDGPCVPICSFP